MLSFRSSKSTLTMFHIKDRRGMIIACPRYKGKKLSSLQLKKKKKSLWRKKIHKFQFCLKVIDDLQSLSSLMTITNQLLMAAIILMTSKIFSPLMHYLRPIKIRKSHLALEKRNRTLYHLVFTRIRNHL